MSAGTSAQANMSEDPKAPWTGAFEDTVGYDILQQPDGLWVVRLELAEKHLNQYGIAHGGVPLTLLDVAGGSAVYQLGLSINRIATISMNTNFIQGAMPGRLTAIGEIEGHGKTVAYTRMRLHQGELDGPLLATAQGSYRLFLKS